MFSNKKCQILSGLAALILLVPASYADGIFIMIEGIEGESVRYTNPAPAIEAIAFDWGIARESSEMGITAGGYISKVRVNALTFSHYVDKATPKLMKLCAQGRVAPNAKIVVQRMSADRPVDYFVMDLKNVMISSVQIVGSSQSGRLEEAISLTFTAYQITYSQTGPKGQVEGKVVTSYDIDKAAAT